MERKTMWIKEWFVDKAQREAEKYNCYIDYAKRTEDEFHTPLTINGCVSVIAEVLKETEKAVYVNLSTGDTLGSIAGWKTWIPKSVIMEV